MRYTAELKPKAIKDLKSIPFKDRKKIVERIDLMEDNLSGNVKKLTNHTPEYRMLNSFSDASLSSDNSS